MNVYDPYVDWCEQHIEELEKYSDCYLAVHLNDGIIIAEKTAEAFLIALERLDLDYRKHLYKTHSSSWTNCQKFEFMVRL